MSQLIAGVEFREQREVIDFADGIKVRHAGSTFVVDHTQGHTLGSVVLRARIETATRGLEVVFAGDTLFAGSIGRERKSNPYLVGLGSPSSEQ